MCVQVSSHDDSKRKKKISLEREVCAESEIKNYTSFKLGVKFGNEHPVIKKEKISIIVLF